MNDEYIHRELELIGVEIVDGSESLEFMVDSFSRSSHVAGVHGSIFANSFLVNENTKLLEFCPKGRPDYTFRNKNKLTSNYTHKLIDSDEGFNVNLDLKELLDFYAS